jgi:hypothetical protein
VLVSVTLTVSHAYLFEFFGIIRNFDLFNSNLLQDLKFNVTLTHLFEFLVANF